MPKEPKESKEPKEKKDEIESDSLRHRYQEYGVEGYYSRIGSGYHKGGRQATPDDEIEEERVYILYVESTLKLAGAKMRKGALL